VFQLLNPFVLPGSAHYRQAGCGRGHGGLLSSGPWLIETQSGGEGGRGGSVPQSRSRVAGKVSPRPANGTMQPGLSCHDRRFEYGACSSELAQCSAYETTKQLRNMQAMCPPVLQHNFLTIARSTAVSNLSLEARNESATTELF
jgi:hypothetical protein